MDKWGRRRGLDIHHINYLKTHNYWDNLISLCANCHGKTGTDRGFWQNFFSVRIHNLYKDYDVGEQLELGIG